MYNQYEVHKDYYYMHVKCFSRPKNTTLITLDIFKSCRRKRMILDLHSYRYERNVRPRPCGYLESLFGVSAAGKTEQHVTRLFAI